MAWLDGLRERLVALFRKEKVERELDEELRFHVEQEIQQHVRAGVGEQEARRLALRDFGGVERTKEAVRDERGVRVIEDALADVRYALRGMVRQPGFAAVAVLTLALGIGANTAVFSVLRAVLLRPLPFDDVDRVVRVAESGFDELDFWQTSMPNYLDWRENDVFSAMAGYLGGPRIDTGRDFAERIVLGRVTPEFFSVLGIRPMLGRSFLPEEARAEAPVVVLSHSYWLRAFGDDSAVVGKQVLLDDEPFTVVGVMGPEVREIHPFTMEMLTPIADAPRDFWRRHVRFLRVVARLKPGATMEQARLEMGAMGERLTAAYPDANEGRRVVAAPFIDALVGDVRTPLLLISGAVGLVLLIGCANVANLLLARSTSRSPEFALRAAVGASRARLFRQALTESLLLGLFGGGVGLAFAMGVRSLLLAIGPRDIPRLEDTSLDGTVLMMTFGVSVLSAVMFGLVPALRASIASPQTFQRGDRGSVQRSGGLRFLVASEVALALILLIGGGLFVSSFLRLVSVDPGYDPSGVLTMRITLPRTRYPDAESRIRFYSQLTERIRGVAGVQSATISALPALANGFFNADIRVGDSENAVDGSIWRVMPDYFRTLNIDLLAGRTILPSDGIDDAQVAILGASSARRLFGDDDPIGRRVTFTSHLRPDEGPREVVGIVGDVRSFGLDRDVPVQLYIPFAQWAGSTGHLAARVAGEPLSFVSAVRREIAAIDDNLPIQDISTLEDRLSLSVSRPRFYTVFLSAFAVVAVLLAAGGVYGVLSYAVSQRARELGIRIALGARGADVLRLVVREGMAPTLVGVVFGLVIAVGASRLLQNQLFEISASDPRVVSLGALTVVIVALIACVTPARRASRVDPVEALKAE